jgi:hypothetical protein
MTQKSSTTLIQKVSSAFGLSLLLWGCGGGGGGGVIVEATQTFSGVAIDGYLEGATAFLDLNDNGEHDANEPKSLTDENGQFTLNATASQFAKHRVVVLVPAGAIDSNTGPVDAPFSLTSPAGHGSVVSPLTTLVAAHMAEGSSFDDALSKVGQDLRLEGNVMKDFMADDDFVFQKIAVAVTEILKTTDIVSSKEQLIDIKSNTNLKVPPLLDEIPNFNIDQVDMWSRLQVFAKQAAQPATLELNSQWVKFLQKEAPVITSLKINNTPEPDLINLIDFSITQLATNNFQMEISAPQISVVRGLIFDEDLNLINVTAGSENQRFQFTDPNIAKSLPTQVSYNSTGSYFGGQDLTKCKTISSYSTSSANGGNLNFSLDLVTSLEDGNPCQTLRPTSESFYFLLTKDGLFLEKATAKIEELNIEIELIFANQSQHHIYKNL